MTMYTWELLSIIMALLRWQLMYKQITQARKPLFVLTEKAMMLHLPADIVLELFETCVVPVLLYGAEIWSWENPRDIEIFHCNFLQSLLKTFKFTPNCILYAKLVPITCQQRLIYKWYISGWNWNLWGFFNLYWTPVDNKKIQKFNSILRYVQTIDISMV